MGRLDESYAELRAGVDAAKAARLEEENATLRARLQEVERGLEIALDTATRQNIAATAVWKERDEFKARAEALQKQVDRLEALVEEAFMEGAREGRFLAWETSDVRAAVREGASTEPLNQIDDKSPETPGGD